MRDAAITEIAIREVATFCELADVAYAGIDTSGNQEAVRIWAQIHAFMSHCGMAARLLWSPDLAEHAHGQMLSEVLELPRNYRIEDESVRQILDRYDIRLSRGLALRGEAMKILDFNIGDRDSFEEEQGVFLRHYDPTVDTLTLMEEEFHLGHIAAELADVRTRAEAWLAENATFEARPAKPRIPPVR